MGIYDVSWHNSMQQTFSFYRVNPDSWRDLPDPITTVTKCDITRDSEDSTLCYATLTADDLEGEEYIRVYMDVTQDKAFHHIPLGTFLTQTNLSSFDGKLKGLDIDAFSPLIELKEANPPIGFFIPKNVQVSPYIKQMLNENCRAPLSANAELLLNNNEYTLESDFVANSDETWLDYITALLNSVSLSLGLTELGEIDIVESETTIENKTPIWTFADDQDSILYPEINIDQDLFGIPNVIELILSDTNDANARKFVSKNENINSPLSIQNRGRKIVERVYISEIIGVDNIDTYYQMTCDSILDQRSTVDYTISYKHGFCPVKVGDVIEVKYNRSGFGTIKAKVASQSIECSAGCAVSETAIYTVNLWR